MLSKVAQSCLRIISGDREITTNLKFTILMVCVSLIHLCYACCFYAQNVSALFYYNLFVIFLYAGNGLLMYYKHYRPAALLTLLEVWNCNILFCLLVGWNTGFPLMCLILVPIVYYLGFSTGCFRRRIFTPTVFSLLSLLVFLTGRAVTLFLPPAYSHLSNFFTMTLYLFNTLAAFSIVILFSLFFLFEIRNAQTALQDRNAYLDRIAGRDPLTMLLNRRSMHTALQDALLSHDTREQSFSLILCDIDDFKQINDTYGHECGDLVLIHITELIRGCASPDDAVCRWGGEEILILTGQPLAPAAALAERIREKIALSPTNYGQAQICHTMTFGVSSFLEGYPIEQSIRAADLKLYTGKKRGKNQVIA